jgi:hypothetical protein
MASDTRPGPSDCSAESWKPASDAAAATAVSIGRCRPAAGVRARRSPWPARALRRGPRPRGRAAPWPPTEHVAQRPQDQEPGQDQSRQSEHRAEQPALREQSAPATAPEPSAHRGRTRRSAIWRPPPDRGAPTSAAKPLASTRCRNRLDGCGRIGLNGRPQSAVGREGERGQLDIGGRLDRLEHGGGGGTEAGAAAAKLGQPLGQRGLGVGQAGAARKRRRRDTASLRVGGVGGEDVAGDGDDLDGEADEQQGRRQHRQPPRPRRRNPPVAAARERSLAQVERRFSQRLGQAVVALDGDGAASGQKKLAQLGLGGERLVPRAIKAQRTRIAGRETLRRRGQKQGLGDQPLGLEAGLLDARQPQAHRLHRHQPDAARSLRPLPPDRPRHEARRAAGRSAPRP